VPIVNAQSYLLSLLDDLPMPAGKPNAKAYITPPDPRVQGRIPAIYIWPSDGEENRSAELGGTIPRNTGPGTSSGTKGILHKMDVYLTWFSGESGKVQDPVFPSMVDAVMFALRFCMPNPAYITDPNTNLTSTIYNTGEDISYRIGVESTADERIKRYDALMTVSMWEIFQALSPANPECIFFLLAATSADVTIPAPAGKIVGIFFSVLMSLFTMSLASKMMSTMTYFVHHIFGSRTVSQV
jgi:hypothetical protein